jgi:hypothetical protein
MISHSRRSCQHITQGGNAVLYFWMRFFGGATGYDGPYLGTIVNAAEDPIEAIRRTHARGVYPGGGVDIVGFYDIGIPDAYLDRLLSEDECAALNALLVGEVH